MPFWSYLALAAGALVLAMVVLVLVGWSRHEVRYYWDEYEVRDYWDD